MNVLPLFLKCSVLSSLLTSLYISIAILTWFAILLISVQDITPWYLFFLLQLTGFLTTWSANTVSVYWWLSYYMLTVLLLKSGNVVKKDWYDCPPFSENIAVIRNIYKRLFCLSSQGNFGMHILLFTFQTYIIANFLNTLLDIVS